MMHHLMKNGSIPQTNTPLMFEDAWQRPGVDLCNCMNQIPFCQQTVSSRARKETKHSENSMHMRYLLFTRRAVVATETLISRIATLQCAGCRAYSPDLLSYLDAVIQDMHAILAHLLYF
jgi:hypothetical protein